MKQQKNNFIVCIVLMQFFSLYSSNEFPQISDNSCNVPQQHTVSFDSYHNTQNFNKVIVSCGVKELPNTSYMQRANHSIIDCYGSSEFKNHFVTVITSLMYEAIENYHVAIPGYTSAHGLRDCINALSTFAHSDKIIIENFKSRLESYCSRIEDVVCDRHNAFSETINHAQQIALAHIYADFLKEFYAEGAPYLFYEQSQKNALMQKVMPQINWHWYDGRNYTSSQRTIEQRYASSVNGNLGAVHKALEAGDSATAYAIGKQRVKTEVSGLLWGTKEKTISVFEQYPALQRKVEQKYFADQAKAKQERVAKECAMQQKTVQWQQEYEIGFDQQKCLVSSDLLSQRYSAAKKDHVVKFYEQIYKVSPEKAACIVPEFLSSNKKEIVFEGSHLQHQFVQESLSVIDTVISCDLVEPIKDATLDLVNASLMSNKTGDILTTSYTLDTCWAIIDFGKKAAKLTYETSITITEGILEGTGEALYGAAHTICHPIKAAKEFGKSLATVGYCFGQAIYAAAEYEGAADLIETHPHIAQEMMQKLNDESILPVLLGQAKTISLKDVTRFGSKAIADVMLLHGATKVISSVAKGCASTLLSCMRKGTQAADVATTVEGVPVACAEEIVSFMETVEEVSVTTKVIFESRVLIENLVNGLRSEIAGEIAILKEKFACISNCLPDCGKRGFAEFINKHIKIPYEHILGIELIWNEAKGTLAGISGFHHDFMGALENSNLLKFVRKGIEKNGCYMADIILEGKTIPGKTFFPQHWSREKVISKIYEAYGNFTKSGTIAELCADGKYKIQGLTNEGIKIEMYITPKGHIKSAYPIVNMEL